jgi:purine-nucleoside phosphorylase
MTNAITYAMLHETAETLRAASPVKPRVGLVLGSGLGELAEDLESSVVLPFADVPHFPLPSIEGHQPRIVFGVLSGQPVMILQGRVHYYEGHSMQRITLPIRAMQLLGVEILVLTNAAGGINRTFGVGDLMLLKDHIGLICMGGHHPLRGANDERLGPRFPDMSQAYDPHLRALALRVGEELGLPLHEGIYVGLGGPSFETPAELRFLQAIGADAVGMSTVPEAIVARHGGMRVIGVSGITNIAVLEPSEGAEATHEEVLEAGRLIVPRLSALLRGLLVHLPAPC